MAEPTAVELAAFKTNDEIATWCGLTDPPKGQLYTALGCSGADSFRPLGGMPESDYVTAVTAIQQGGTAPSVFALGGWKLFGRVARLACGAEETRDQKNAKAVALAKAAPAPSASSAAASAPVAKTGMTKMSMVVDQGLDDEVPTVKEVDFVAAYAKYETKMGGPPAEDKEPSIEQFTGVLHLLNLQAPPYVDFSIFGPHSIRLRKRMKLGGFHITQNGTFEKCELYGPATFTDWMKSYRVLSTVLIMLEAVEPEELEAYADLIRGYVSRYSSTAWPTIYQADVRQRQERSQHHRRIGVKMHNADPAVAKAHGYDDATPWRYVWKKMSTDSEWWSREVSENCILLLTKTASLASLLDGDATIAGAGGSLASQGLPTHEDRKRGRSPDGRPPPTAKDWGQQRPPPRSTARAHNTTSDGSMTTNRRGVGLCNEFQAGGCTETVFTQQGYRCAKNRSYVHQCSKCLSPQHGAHECSGKPAPVPSQHTAKGGGKGKGKGKKGRY